LATARAEEPERGPQTLAGNETHACFEHAVCLVERAAGHEPGRREPVVPAVPSGDREMPVAVEGRISRRRRVALELSVPPAAGADVVIPARRTWSSTGSAVELVGKGPPGGLAGEPG